MSKPTVTVEVVPPPEPEKEYRITVDKTLAEVLYAFVGQVGSDDDSHKTDALYEALRRVLRQGADYSMQYKIETNTYGNLKVTKK